MGATRRVMQPKLCRARPPRRVQQQGFTLIELMITVTIIGILASVAIPSFLAYQRKSKTVEMYEGIDKITQGAMVYFNEHAHLPPPTDDWGPKMTHEARCAAGQHRFPEASRVDFSNPRWTNLLYMPSGRTYYRYRWSILPWPTPPKTDVIGHVSAEGDLDCDGKKALFQTVLVHVGAEVIRKGTFVVLGSETE